MKAKKKNTKKYAVGGYIQAGLGAAQAIYGASQLPRARAEFAAARAAAPSLETPSQFYENYRNAYDAEIARMESESIDRNIGTSVQALQGAGGRSLVGGLSAVTAQSQNERNRMLAQERSMRLQAGQELARAEERSVQMRENRSQADMQRASQVYDAALGNIGAGLSSLGTGLFQALYDGEDGSKKNKDKSTDTKTEVQTEPTVKTESTKKPLSLPNLSISAPEFDFAKNYMSRFERPEASITPDGSKNPMMQEAYLSEWYDKTFGKKDDVFGPPAPSGGANQRNFYEPAYPVKGPTSTHVFENGRTAPGVSARKKLGIEPSQNTDLRGIGSEFLGGLVSPFAPAAGSMLKANSSLYEQGGMMTKGAFDHDKNPIDLVQNGEKVGEATGGEYILNPEQAKAVAKESSYARKLFKRFEKNAKKKK